MRRFPPLLLCALLFGGCQASVLDADLPAQDLTTLSDNDLHREVTEAYGLAEAWFLGSINEKNIFRYIHEPLSAEEPRKNNPIRQLMAARLLGELCGERADLLPLHRRNLAFYLEHWYRERDGLGYVLFDGSSKLGSNGMLLRALVASPDFPQYEAKAKELADGILSSMHEDGALDAWFIRPAEPRDDDDYLLTFYSGEALLGLMEYWGKTGDRHILNAARKSQGYYIGRYVTGMDAHYYPAYVPWHTMSLEKLWEATGDRTYADAVFALNDKLLELMGHAPYPGRFFNPATPEYGTPHSSSDGVYTEGLAHAWAVALDVGDAARAARYREALGSAVQNLRLLQFSPLEVQNFPAPERVRGAIRASATSLQVRIDSTQHAMDAFRQIVKVLGN